MKLAIYQTSDLHGYVYPTNYVKEQPLGILKIGSYIINDEKNYDASLKVDCGDLIFDDERQKTDSGGSGCGCSAVVTCGYFYKKLMRREIKSLLLVSTGALMSTTSSLQGETIPGIAHAVAIEFK